jgi:hypothetical protein
MIEKTHETRCGIIHYWTNEKKDSTISLIFLPGLTADHRLFDKQIEYFKDKLLVEESTECDMLMGAFVQGMLN